MRESGRAWLKALWMSLAVMVLGGIAIVGVVLLPVYQASGAVEKRANVILLALQKDWSPTNFSSYASPKLLAESGDWKKQMTDLNAILGPIKEVGKPKIQTVMTSEYVPKKVIYMVEVPIQTEKGGSKRVIMGLAQFEVGYQLTQFQVTDPR